MSFHNGTIRIKVKTWKRDSYGLYDYETTNYHSQYLDVCKSGKLIRSNNELNFMLPSLIEDSDDSAIEDVSTGQEVLADISEGPEGIKIVPNTAKSNENNQMWLSVDRNEGDQGHLLKENDTIKLGRVIFKIKQIKFPETTAQIPEEMLLKSLKDYMEEDRKLVTPSQDEETRNSTCCKICLSDKVEHDDPLISPCKCIGSVKFVHLKCLQNWVKSKLNMEEDYKIITIFWQLLNCELCKAKLPLCISHQGNDFLLFPFETKFTGPYIILESFSKEKDPAGIHIIDLSDKESFKIGRGHDCDLKLSDISVSRIHAVLNIDQGKLYLKDNYSKFGTLILLKDPITLDNTNSRSAWIQCGKTVLRFSLRRPWNTMIPYLPLFPKNKVPPLKPDHVLAGNKDEKPQRETRDEL